MHLTKREIEKFMIFTAGEISSNNPTIELNKNSEIIPVRVINTGDRPVQTGSHFHFFEANRFLRFLRKLTFGCRLNIPAWTAVSFEPDEKKILN